MAEPRTPVIVLGDQLDRHSSAFDDFDRAREAVWMAEFSEESTHVWSCMQRIAVFLSAMRHFADDLRRVGVPLDYARLGEDSGAASLAAVLRDAIGRLNCLHDAIAQTLSHGYAHHIQR